MTDLNPSPVQIVAEDPDLARGLDPARAHDASQRLLARPLDVPRGPWRAQQAFGPAPAAIGLLVLDGLLVREATVGLHPSAELIGPGDVVRAWEEPDMDVLLPRAIEWSALTPVRMAVLDHGFVVRAAAWPEVLGALTERAARRAERIAVMQAIAHLTRVDDRLLALMWCLAERWGRVVPDGVLVSLRLPHRTLAAMIGARRPSVTTALGQLMARGELTRRKDGGYVLTGSPPEDLPQRGDAARSNGFAA